MMESRHLLFKHLGGGLSCSPSALIRPTTSPAATNITRAPRRHQSSTARTKRALKIPPHASFLVPEQGHNHIIYNPPPAAPSVYHTPFKFLPRSDPRRQANLAQLLRSTSASSVNVNTAPTEPIIPPKINSSEGTPKPYNVTQEQVDEMRRLRATDPVEWSVHKLAKKFGCAPLFVIMCCKASQEHRDQERARLEAIKARWGPIRINAREERKKRKALLLKGSI